MFDKYRELKVGDVLEVGDILVVDTKVFGKKKYQITRTTKTTALSKIREGYEHKFQRVLQYNMTKPQEKWNILSYSAYRPIEVEND